MVLEEQPHKSSKKNKLKKIPQRGLGVAQLEKLRCMEEQQRIAGVASSSSDFSAQGLAFPPPPPATVAVMKPRAASTFFTEDHQQQQQQRQQPLPPPGFFPMIWNAAVDAKEDASLMRKIGVPLHHMKQPPPPPPPIASLQANSPTCHRMEPPSNQNNSNNYDLLSCWRSEQNKNSVEMMVCNKRSAPPPAFHLDDVVVAAGNHEAHYPRKHPFLSNECSRATGSNLVRLEFQASRGNTSTPFVDLTSSDLYIEKRFKENCGVQDGNFLSLASVSAPSLTPFDMLQYFQYDHSDFSLKNAQKNSVNVTSSNELPFYDFLLTAPIRNEKTTMLEIRESPTGDIDLNLRL